MDFDVSFLRMIACSLSTSVSDKEIIYFLGLAIVSHLFTFIIPYITVFIKQTLHYSYIGDIFIVSLTFPFTLLSTA